MGIHKDNVVVNNTFINRDLIIPTFTPKSTRQKEMLDKAKAYLFANVDNELLKNYKLPTHETKESIRVLPVSSGKDSSCLAIVLKVLFPTENFIYVFTDTKAESKECYRTLSELEDLLDMKIVRLSHPQGLFGRIEHYGNYLPSNNARWCTAELKIKPIDKWFKSNFDYSKQKVNTFVGFTYGEVRVGMITDEDEVSSHYPLIDLKITTNEVFGMLGNTIGISEIYKRKSRSGCFSCYYLRRYEKSMMLFDAFDEFEISKKYEKLSTADEDRYTLKNNPALRDALYSKDNINISGKQSYYLPPSVDTRTEFKAFSTQPRTLKLTDKLSKPKFEDQMSIFDVIDDLGSLSDNEQVGYIYVAVAFWVSSAGRDYFGDNSYSGLYRTEFATFSKSLTGLKRSLHFFVEHKLGVAPLYDMTKDELSKDLKIGLYQIKIPKPILAVLDEPSSDSFTWANNESYAQIETISRLAHSVLTYEGLEQFWDQNYARLNYSDMEELHFINSFAWGIKREIDEKKSSYKALNSTIEWSGIFPLPTVDEIEDMLFESFTEKDDEEFKMSAAQSCAICSI